MDKGILTASLSTIFIGFSIVIASVGNKLVHPLVFTTIGYFISIVFLLVLSKAIREKLEMKKLFSFKKDLFSIIISRSVIGQLLLMFGFSMVPAIRAIFLMRLEPIFVFLISILLLKEQPKNRKVALLLVLLFGALIFTTDGSFDLFSQITFGDILIIGAMGFLAYSYIPSASISKKVNTNTVTMGANLLPAIIFLPIVLLFVPGGFSVNLNSFYLILIYTITFYVLGLFLWFKSLTKTKPWVVASIMSLEPIAGALLAFLWLGQILSTVQFMGAVVMMIATYFIARENAK